VAQLHVSYMKMRMIIITTTTTISHNPYYRTPVLN
jgi:hypothetical protein